MQNDELVIKITLQVALLRNYIINKFSKFYDIHKYMNAYIL